MVTFVEVTMTGKVLGDGKTVKKKAPYLNSKSLDTVKSNLKHRLEPSLSHLPVPENHRWKRRCNLHRFVNRSWDYKQGILVYSNCNVPLCI